MPPALNRFVPRTARSIALVTGGAVAVAAAGVGVGVATAAQAHDVTLVVDGRTSQVETTADTVGEVLAAQGLKVGAQDKVAPAAAAAVEDGSQITLAYARPVAVTVDGKTREVITTATSVDAVLTQLGMRSQSLELSASRSLAIGRNGLNLEVRTPKNVTVVTNGKSHVQRTTAITVREALADARIVVKAKDRVQPGLKAPVVDGQRIVVDTYRAYYLKHVRGIAHATTTQRSASAWAGTRTVVTPGRDGQLVFTVRASYLGKQRVGRTVVSKTVTRQPVTAVIRIGTKMRPVAQPAPVAKPAPAPRPARSTPARSSGSSSRTSGGSGTLAGSYGTSAWVEQVRRCIVNRESGGNYRAQNPSSTASGAYQFLDSTWQGITGLSGSAKDYPPSVQDRAFYKAFANGAGKMHWYLAGGPQCF